MEWLRVFKFSLLIHIIMIGIVIIGGRSFISQKKPMVVDFRIVDRVYLHPEKAESKKQEWKNETKHIGTAKTSSSPGAVIPPTQEIQSPVQPAMTISSDHSAAKKTPTVNPDQNTTVASVKSGETSNVSVEIEKAKIRYLKEHFTYIRDMIMKNLSYPIVARKRGWTGKVIVSLFVNMDGNVEGLKVLEGSGFDILDRNALETIKKVCPLPKPYAKAELIVPIVYKLE